AADRSPGAASSTRDRAGLERRNPADALARIVRPELTLERESKPTHLTSRGGSAARGAPCLRARVGDPARTARPTALAPDRDARRLAREAPRPPLGDDAAAPDRDVDRGERGIPRRPRHAIRRSAEAVRGWARLLRLRRRA